MNSSRRKIHARFVEEITRRGRESQMFIFVDSDLKLDLPQAKSSSIASGGDLQLDQAAVAKNSGFFRGCLCQSLQLL